MVPVSERIAKIAQVATGWRRDLHSHPELGFDVPRTAGIVAKRLREFGCDEVVEGVGRSGVVGVIVGGGSSMRTVGLRADMDALPMEEETGVEHASRVPGRMHACGHDGHTSMLLGAAKYLCDTRGFDGRVAVIFQPAEEQSMGGGRVMVEDGLMERFKIDEVYGMHNLPGLGLGHFSICSGPILASTDSFDIVVHGRGGHAAKPHETVDPIPVVAQIVQSLQTIVSRNTDPLDSCVVSVTKLSAGSAYNVIPSSAKASGTIRTLEAKTRMFAQERLRALVENIAQAYGARADVDIRRGYPVTRNHEAQTLLASAVAERVAGQGRVESMAPLMGGEDFSYMLEARPGAMIFIGNGDSAGLHHPAYDFNDAVLAAGISYWVNLAEAALQRPS